MKTKHVMVPRGDPFFPDKASEESEFSPTMNKELCAEVRFLRASLNMKEQEVRYLKHELAKAEGYQRE